MNSSLIISIYRLQDELPLLISSLAQQSVIPDEIIFAEDDVSEQTIRILEEEKKKYPLLCMKLVQHKDRGFRKAEIVNKAVALSSGEKLIFLDGDCLPHRHYVKEYVHNLRSGMLLNSRAVYLDDGGRSLFMGEGGVYQQPSFLKIWSRTFRRIRYSIYFPLAPIRLRNSAMMGSSWACMKSDFLRVNGFDERFCETGYGYEDIDISHRLNRAGVQSYVPKHRVIYYHFGRASTGEQKANSMMESKKILEFNDLQEKTACELGVNQWLGKISPVWVT